MEIKITEHTLKYYAEPNFRVELRIPANVCDFEQLKLNNWNPKLDGNTVVIKHYIRAGRHYVDSWIKMIKKHFINAQYVAEQEAIEQHNIELQAEWH
jgi:hypothetical protein